MKRIILLLMCVISMVTYAQKTPARKVMPSTNHISFMGISLGENLNTFKKKLKAINYKVREHNDEYEPWTDIEGCLGTVSGLHFDIDYDFKNKGIAALIGRKQYENKTKAESDYNYLQNLLIKKYPNAKSEKLYFVVVKSYARNCYLNEIKSQHGTILGHIYLYLDEKRDDFCGKQNLYYELSIKFVDNQNRLSYDSSLNYNTPIQYNTNKGHVYNITKYATPIFDNCSLEIYDDFLKIIGDKFGKKYCLYATGEDRRDVLDTLFSLYTSNDDRAGIFQLYLRLAFLDINGYNICTTSSMPDATSEYCFPKQNNSQPHQMSKGELWFCLWEGSERIAKYKADGSYQRRMQMFINTWNSIAGSGGGSTNWDGLNDAQKAAIHEHDNAR